MHILEKLQLAGKVDPPNYVVSNAVYLCIMGSEAYGVATDLSDKDIHGVCIPPKEYIFPHLGGFIHGFDNLPGHCLPKKQQWQEHHVQCEKKSYDFAIYQIHRFFHLASRGNPSLIDALFVPRECIVYSNQIGELLRENRHIFLSKSAWPKYKGYAFGQLDKLTKYDVNGKRAATIDKYGYDIKNAYHVVRLLNEIEQILTTGDLDLRQNREQLKSIRKGDWTLHRVRSYFEDKEKELETLKNQSELREEPDMDKIRALLIQCLEIHYGNLESAVVNPSKPLVILKKINELVENSKVLLEF